MRSYQFLALLACLFIGCGDSTTAKNPDPVEISGKVTQGGKPLSDVTFNLQPTGAGGQAMVPVTNGEFKTSVFPGKYTYYITEGKVAAAYKGIPQKYREGAMDRQIEIAAGSNLEIKLD